MDRRVTLALGVVALAMLAYIVLVESGTLTTGEIASRRGHLVERFVRARVTGVVVTHGDSRIRMRRHQDEDETLDTFDVGTWSIEEPIESLADADSVDSLLSAVEWLDARRELSGVTAEDRTRFGLDAPRATLEVTVATEVLTIEVGGADPRGEGVYLAIDTDPTRAYVVGTDFPEALEHDADHFRQKDLYPDFRTRDAETVVLRNGAGTIELARVTGRWTLRRPVEMHGRGSTIDEMLRTVTDLRAARFLAETDADLDEAWGLGTPASEISITLAPWPAGSSHTGEPRHDIHVRVGGPCPEHEGELVLVAGSGPVVCVEAESIENFDVAVDRLRESRAIATPDDDVERAELTVGGVTFELRRDDSDWVLVEGATESPADAGAVEEWLGALRQETLTSIEPATDDALGARGLGEPRAILTLRRTDDGGNEVLRLGASDAGGVWVRRGEEAQLTHFQVALTELLSATAIRFRARRLVDRTRDEIDRISITRSGAEEVVAKSGSAWRITAPLTSNADGAAAGDATDGLGPLEALRFVAATAEREHGLASPRLVARVHYTGGEAADDEEDDHAHDEELEADEESGGPREPLEVVLRIGAATEGGAFAQLEGTQAVFVVSSALVDSLLFPLVSRDVLAIAASDVAQLTIIQGVERRTLLGLDGGWTLDGAAAPTETTQALLDALADLRALGTTGYGGSITRPIATLEIVRHSADSAIDRLTIGPRAGTAADAWHEVRREGLDVGFRVRASVIDTFLGYAPAVGAP